jgi:hypothetical protein
MLFTYTDVYIHTFLTLTDGYDAVTYGIALRLVLTPRNRGFMQLVPWLQSRTLSLP